MFENESRALLPYRVGGLLYVPAIKSGIADKIMEHKYPYLTSAAFCLEDSIRDEALEKAELSLKETLAALHEFQQRNGQLPLLFVRIRSPRHLQHIHRLLEDAEQVLTGYILPKFDLTNAEAYAALIQELRRADGKRLYYMPVLETRMIADIRTRTMCLWSLRELCDGLKERILNIRVGGTDLCGLYGLRRTETQTIYETGVIRDVLVDIINVFAPDYVVSGVVWEYFGADGQASWAVGLRRETAQDRLNGFIGKTAIHPAQLPLIYQSMRVSRRDYLDAMEILQWESAELGVAKGRSRERMNEVKCHTRWALKIAALEQIYGIQEDFGACAL